jgi:hypothetical protein
VRGASRYRTQTPFTICLQTAPGGTGLTVGENESFAPGPTAFSVGVRDIEADVDGLVVLVGVPVVVEGSSLVLLPQPAVSIPMATRAPPPTTIAIRGNPRSVVIA